MAIVINPKQEIESHLKSWGYLPFNPNNNPKDTNDAIISGAAHLFIDLVDVDFTRQGYCWASDVKSSSLPKVLAETVEKIESDLSCYSDSENSTIKRILDKAAVLLEKDNSK